MNKNRKLAAMETPGEMYHRFWGWENGCADWGVCCFCLLFSQCMGSKKGKKILDKEVEWEHGERFL